MQANSSQHEGYTHQGAQFRLFGYIFYSIGTISDLGPLGCPHVRRTLGEPLGNTLPRGSRQSLDATRNHVWRCGFQWDSVAKEIYRLAICRRFMHIPFVFRVRVESLTNPGKSKRIRKQGNRLEQIACEAISEKPVHAMTDRGCERQG